MILTIYNIVRVFQTSVFLFLTKNCFSEGNIIMGIIFALMVLWNVFLMLGTALYEDALEKHNKMAISPTEMTDEEIEEAVEEFRKVLLEMREGNY